MEHNKNNYQSTKDTVTTNYFNCLAFAIAPLTFSFLLGFSSKGPVPVGRGSKPMAIASLFITVPLTVVTAGIGAAGAIANTLYSAVALPIMAIKDKAQNEDISGPAQEYDEPISDINSSTQHMLNTMPPQESKEIIETPIPQPVQVDAKASIDDEVNCNKSGGELAPCA